MHAFSPARVNSDDSLKDSTHFLPLNSPCNNEKLFISANCSMTLVSRCTIFLYTLNNKYTTFSNNSLCKNSNIKSNVECVWATRRKRIFIEWINKSSASSLAAAKTPASTNIDSAWKTHSPAQIAKCLAHYLVYLARHRFLLLHSAVNFFTRLAE
jgi:hypothetical protein